MAGLKLGDRGFEVRKLQILLNNLIFTSPKLAVDGDFGKGTLRALLKAQQQLGLKPDGIAGPATFKGLGLVGQPKTDPTKQKASGKSWLEIAEAEIGIKEDAAKGKHTNRILEYHKTTTLKATTDETPWCSSFVNWVVIQAGDKGTNNALAKSWLDWGNPSKGAKGDIIVIKKKTPGMTKATGSPTGFHVGFFISTNGTSIRILGGNQGDQVKYSNFMLSGYEVKGYRNR